MEYGAHLPLIEIGGGPRTAADLAPTPSGRPRWGTRYLCANDHLFFSRPWLDGPSALAATIEASGDMTLATTVSLPVIRGPVQTARTLAALHQLSGGRLVAGLGPGSSPRDYEAIGVPFEERWRRFDDAVEVLRPLLDGTPVWIASWGSAAGMRRVARLGDGWLASGYNTTPERVREGCGLLPDGFPNAVATMWMYVTESPARRRPHAGGRARAAGQPAADALRELALPIGSAEQCAERISAYAAAGAQRVFVWPLADDLRQLELFRERVVPIVRAPA